MTREEKSKYIDDLAVEIQDSSVFYITDTSELPVDQINAIRRKCFQSNISLRVVKNALLQKAMDKVEGKDFGALRDVLKGFECGFQIERFNDIEVGDYLEVYKQEEVKRKL